MDEHDRAERTRSQAASAAELKESRICPVVADPKGSSALRPRHICWDVTSSLTSTAVQFPQPSSSHGPSASADAASIWFRCPHAHRRCLAPKQEPVESWVGGCGVVVAFSWSGLDGLSRSQGLVNFGRSHGLLGSVGFYMIDKQTV